MMRAMLGARLHVRITLAEKMSNRQCMMMYGCHGSIAVCGARAGVGPRVAAPEDARQDGPSGARLRNRIIP